MIYDFGYVFDTFGILAICGLLPMMGFWYVFDMLMILFGHYSWAGLSAMICFLRCVCYVLDTRWILPRLHDTFLISCWSLFDTLWIPSRAHDTFLICFRYIYATLLIFSWAGLLQDMRLICFGYVFDTQWNPPWRHDTFLICLRYPDVLTHARV